MKGREKWNDDRMAWDACLQGQEDMDLHDILIYMTILCVLFIPATFICMWMMTVHSCHFCHLNALCLSECHCLPYTPTVSLMRARTTLIWTQPQCSIIVIYLISYRNKFEWLANLKLQAATNGAEPGWVYVMAQLQATWLKPQSNYSSSWLLARVTATLVPANHSRLFFSKDR